MPRMRLLLFTLLCAIAILLIRGLQGISTRRRAEGRPAEGNERPAASPDEIVDVSFEDCRDAGEKGERS